MKVWFLRIEDKIKGPFSFDELRENQELTPDTLVWKEAMPTWIQAGHVEELKSLFEDKEPLEPEEGPKVSSDVTGQDIVLLLDKNPPNPVFWILICLVILTYVVIRLFLQK